MTPVGQGKHLLPRAGGGGVCVWASACPCLPGLQTRGSLLSDPGLFLDFPGNKQVAKSASFFHLRLAEEVATFPLSISLSFSDADLAR